MRPEEYEQLVENSTESIHDAILPRACPGLGKPGTLQWSGAWVRVGMAVQKALNSMMDVDAAVTKMGYPSLTMTNAYAPADVIGDFLRHLTGAMLDTRGHPDDFKAACEALVEPILRVATAMPPAPLITFLHTSSPKRDAAAKNV